MYLNLLAQDTIYKFCPYSSIIIGLPYDTWVFDANVCEGAIMSELTKTDK